MAHFKLDNNADHELDDTSGTVWIEIPNNISVEIYFETDSEQNIKLISVGDAYQDPNGAQNDYDYKLLPEHEHPIKAVIEQCLNDNPVGYDDVEYDTMESLGFTNSDFLYG